MSNEPTKRNPNTDRNETDTDTDTEREPENTVRTRDTAPDSQPPNDQRNGTLDELEGLTTPLTRGAYTGFVEWRSPPSGAGRKPAWVAGFFIGFGLKLAFILYVGAEVIPT